MTVGPLSRGRKPQGFTDEERLQRIQWLIEELARVRAGLDPRQLSLELEEAEDVK